MNGGNTCPGQSTEDASCTLKSCSAGSIFFNSFN